MPKAIEDIETLKKWAAWVRNDPYDEVQEAAAKAVMNLIAYVGTLKAELATVGAQKASNDEGYLKLSSEHAQCAGGAEEFERSGKEHRWLGMGYAAAVCIDGARIYSAGGHPAAALACQGCADNIRGMITFEKQKYAKVPG